MSDYSELVARLRASCDVREAALLRNLAADALEAQGRRLAEAEKDLATTQQCFEERGEVLGQYIHRLAEAERKVMDAMELLAEQERKTNRALNDKTEIKARLAEAEALLREARTTIERLVDAVEDYGGWDDDGRASYATLPICDRIATFLTPPPEVKP